jgi:hypothetical protein
MKRRDFFIASVGASASLVSLLSRAQGVPCPPTGFRIDGASAGNDAECTPGSSPEPSPGPSGFVARPYFFQIDSDRLKALISAGDPTATGSAANNSGQPLGFITAMNGAVASRSSYSDISTWHLAVGGWLTNNSAMQDLAKRECLEMVRRKPGGSPLSGDQYQHIEEIIMNTALVVDCCYSRFTADERAEVANFVNGALTYSEGQDATFWPFGDPHNNYWNNRHLAVCVAALASQGWNPQAGLWQARFEAMSEKFIEKYTPPYYSGPQVTEGHYYSAYVANSMWAMRQYDSVMGTRYLERISFTARDALNLALYQLRPHNGRFFSIGSEAANSTAPFHSLIWVLWYQLMFMASGSVEARVAKTILQSKNVTGDAQNFWARSHKAFANFYWSISSIPAAPVSMKTDRRLVLPTPGGAMTHIRSARGWDTSTSGRAAIIFHCRTAWTGADYPGYSHANVDQPGFQWAQDDQWLALDPEVYGSSGVAAESGSSISSDFANIVTLSSAKYVANGGYPVVLFNEDNTSQSVPHYYQSIDARPYWTMCSTYRREYVWLDDLQVVLIFDRVVTSGGVTKTWRLAVDGVPSISSSVATVTTPGGTNLQIRDLYSTSGGAWTAANLQGVGSVQKAVYQLRQTDSANDFISLKVLSVNGRVTNAALERPDSNQFRVVATIGGATRVVSFFADGSHAVVG